MTDNRAFLNGQNARHHPQEGCFPGTVWSDQAENTPCVEVKVKADDSSASAFCPRPPGSWAGNGVPMLHLSKGQQRVRHDRKEANPSLQPWREANLYDGQLLAP